MDDFERVDVLIVGSGPAGTSTALHLLRADPIWAERIVVVDKAIHPRVKLCGGGVTHLGQNILARLGLAFEPANVRVRQAKLVYQDLSFAFHGDPVFRVVRRDEFDHWLAAAAEAKGVRVRQGEVVTDVVAGGDYIEVTTDKAVYQAQVVVAADGSRSTVRQKLKWDDQSRVARLLEVLTPEDGQRLPEFRDRMAVFEFTQMASGLQGYYWDFPSLVKGKTVMNRGLFDSRTRPERPKANLVQELRKAMARRDRSLDDYQLKGHPIRWFDKKGRFAVPRVLLAGDAAGVDPLMGEGISFALAYGEVAAAALTAAFARQDFTFGDYRDRILAHDVLRQLPTRVWLARLAYRRWPPWIVRLGWRIAGVALRFTRWRDPNYNPVQTPELMHHY